MGAARVLSEHREIVARHGARRVSAGRRGRARRAKHDARTGRRSASQSRTSSFGQHVMVGAAGTVGHRSGAILSAGDSLQVKLFGRGSHGSQPQTAIDPVIMAAATTLRLQTIVSREISPLDSAVLTVGALQAGTKENIIPDDATIKLNVRTYDEDVRKHVLSAIERICRAEATASGAEKPPEFTTLSSYPLTVNDAACSSELRRPFRCSSGSARSRRRPRRRARISAFSAGGGGTLRILDRRRNRSQTPMRKRSGRRRSTRSRATITEVRAGARSHAANRTRGDAHGRRRVAQRPGVVTVSADDGSCSGDRALGGRGRAELLASPEAKSSGRKRRSRRRRSRQVHRLGDGRVGPTNGGHRARPDRRLLSEHRLHAEQERDPQRQGRGPL